MADQKLEMRMYLSYTIRCAFFLVLLKCEVARYVILVHLQHIK